MSLKKSKEPIDYWRLCDQLTVVQAALLVVDVDPSDKYEEIEELHAEERPPGYDAVKNAIKTALLKGTIKGDVVPEDSYDSQNNRLNPIPGTIDVEYTLVDVDSLRDWLRLRGFESEFFFSQSIEVAEYLDPQHPRYAYKLAAAVKAWLAVQGAPLKGKSPKQAAEKWLREHATELQLTDDEGKQNETGIDEISKVVNWQPTGGAPKTANL